MNLETLKRYAVWLIERSGTDVEFLTLVEAWPEFVGEAGLPFIELDDADLEELDDLIAEASVSVWWEDD